RLPEPVRRLRSYPHELSGGQLQRGMIAMAIANHPALLIADEPTTALAVTVQAQILELPRALRAELGTAVLLVTHDMGVVADLADRVVVMRDGQVVEQGEVDRVFAEPREEYTKQLLGAVISLGGTTASPARDVPDTDPLLLLDNLSVTYGGRFRPIT